ncbi:MAG: deoxyribose-phosphate aldolase [Clostridiales bacterium]|nr:deoxyribose-phosphate aldolase [Clostridiales bacterium]
MIKLESYIDYTCLKADATAKDIESLVGEAKRRGFYGVCVNPYYVPYAKKLCEGSDVKVVTVCGFPLGQSVSAVKACEAAVAVSDGADEVDMVINIGALKSGKDKIVEDDIIAVVKCGVPVKVILEAGLLTDEEIIRAVEIAIKAGADFVKTSTGFLAGGATEHAVSLMAKAAKGRIKIKASGGIRTKEAALKFIELGADRIGASRMSE